MQIQRIDLRGKAGISLPRAEMDINSVLTSVEPILATVQGGAESDLLDLCEKFDGVRPSSIRVPLAIIEKALADLDPAIREAYLGAL